MAFAALGDAAFHETGDRSPPRLVRLRGPVLRLAAAIALHAGAVAAAISSSTSSFVDEAKKPGTANAIEVVFINEPQQRTHAPMQVAPVAKPIEKKETPKPVKIAKVLPKVAEPMPLEKAEPVVLQPATSEALASPASAAPTVEFAIEGAAASAAVPVATADLVITNPRFRNPPRPAAYPKRSRELGQQGEALVHARLDPDGDPEEVLIWKSSGFALLDNAALAAVRRWQFEPARRNGRATVAWVEIPVRFQLN